MPPGWPDKGEALRLGRILILLLLLLLLTGRVKGSGESTPILLSRATTLQRVSNPELKMQVAFENADLHHDGAFVTQTAPGSSAILHCRIGRQGSHTVSWMRQVFVIITRVVIISNAVISSTMIITPATELSF